MNVQTTCRLACLFLLTSLFALVFTRSAEAVGYSFGRHPDKERLVFAFDGNTPPRFSVTRTDKQELTVSVPERTVNAGATPPDLGGASLVSGLGRRGNEIVVSLSTDEFGYVSFGLDGTGKVVLDVFADPLGARWKADKKSDATPIVPLGTQERQAPEEQPERQEPKQTAPADVSPTPRPEPAPEQAQEPERAQTPTVSNERQDDAVAEDVPQDSVPKMRQESQKPTLPVFRGQEQRESKQPKPEVSGKRNMFRMKVAPPGAQDSTAVAQAEPTASPKKTTPTRRVQRRKSKKPEPVAVESSGPSSGRMKIIPSGSGQEQRRSEADSEVVRSEDQKAGPAVRRKMTPASPPSKPLKRQEVERNEGVSVNAPKSGRMKIVPPSGATPAQAPERTASGRMKVTPPGGKPAPAVKQEVAPAPEPEPAKTQMAEQAPADAIEKDEEPDASAQAEPAQEEPPRQYDEEGNPIPTHQERLDELMFAARTAIGGRQYEAGIEELDLLLRQRKVPAEMREDAMYMKADALHSLYKDEVEDHFDEINGAYESAINFNLDSYRVPGALLKRGQLNLKVGNVPEAAAFFRILRKKYQGDPNVPLTYYYWGDHYFKNKEYQKAADEFQYLVQVYPDSKFVREASLGLARSLRKLGYDKQAFQVVDFIEKRWPRFYVEFPPFLRLLGDAAYRVGDYEKAKNHYWTYYNIDPQGDEADLILAKLGDAYVKTGRKDAAREIYQKAVADFPDKEGGLVSKMRLAEEGVYDSPSIEDMYSVFDRPYNLKPSQIYDEIVNDHRDSPLASLAQLKKAMWDLWNGKFLDSMEDVKDFEDMFPGSELRGKAQEVGNRAFSKVVGKLVADKNYPKIIELWEEYPFIQENREGLEPDAKLALGLSFWKRQAPAKALEIIMPFMHEPQVPETSEMAMSLALSIFMDNQAWEDVLDVGEAVRDWEIRPKFRRELAYAQALAHENLGQSKKARKLWAELGMDRQLDPLQRAYAQFFLAQEALEENNLRRAYDFAQDAYEVFVKDGKDKAKIRECLRMLTDATERSGRFREAIKWANEFEEMIGPSDPSWPGMRYRLAGLHKKGGNPAKWRVILEELAQNMPDTLYGRMAASDLQIENIERQAQEYQPTNQF